MEFQTPDSIIQTLEQIRRESAKGVEALYAAEEVMVRSQLDYDLAFAKALLNAKGTVADKEALALLATADLKLVAELAKASVNRIKTKLKVLSEQQMSVQTQARMVELAWRVS